MNKELEFLIDVVKQASGLIKPDFKVDNKGNMGDLVTNFDYEIERFIIDKVNKNYPGFSIVSEEYNTNASVTKNCFIIDPIDGTINFANGLPLWGIQVACQKDGEVCASVIYLPEFNELYYADESGAYLNGKKIKVNNLPKEKCLYNIMPHNTLKQIEKAIKHCPLHRDLYSSAVVCSWIAKGTMGGVVLLKDNPWDYMPGHYLIKQAGGHIYNQNNLHIAANSREFLDYLVDCCKKNGLN